MDRYLSDHWDFVEAEQAYTSILKRLEPYADRALLYREISGTAREHFDDRSVDVVFLDSWQTYDNCHQMIAQFTPKVRCGGIIAGHDFLAARRTCGQAVLESLREDETLHLGPDYFFWWQVTCASTASGSDSSVETPSSDVLSLPRIPRDRIRPKFELT